MIEVNLVPFKFQYFEMLLDMHKRRQYEGLPFITMKTLPKIGYICLLGQEPIAAGFLRRVEGGYGQLDTLVSSPHFGSKIRHVAISKVVEALLEDARTLRLEGIIAFSKDEGVLSRAESIGFKRLSDSLIGLSLISGT